MDWNEGCAWEHPAYNNQGRRSPGLIPGLPLGNDLVNRLIEIDPLLPEVLIANGQIPVGCHLLENEVAGRHGRGDDDGS